MRSAKKVEFLSRAKFEILLVRQILLKLQKLHCGYRFLLTAIKQFLSIFRKTSTFGFTKLSSGNFRVNLFQVENCILLLIFFWGRGIAILYALTVFLLPAGRRVVREVFSRNCAAGSRLTKQPTRMTTPVGQFGRLHLLIFANYIAKKSDQSGPIAGTSLHFHFSINWQISIV